ELYVDFGIAGALPVVTMLGFLFGRCYRAIRDHPRTPAFVNYGLCMMFALSFCTFEAGLLRLVGSALMLAAAALGLQRFVWPILVPGNMNIRRSVASGGDA